MTWTDQMTVRLQYKGCEETMGVHISHYREPGHAEQRAMILKHFEEMLFRMAEVRKASVKP